MPSKNLQKHIENYDSIKPLQSYRGIAVTLLIVFGGMNCLSALTSGASTQFIYNLLGLVILSPIFYSIYKGKKWAMILMIVLLGLNQLLILINGSYSGIAMAIAVIFFLSQAITVENNRKTKEKI
ncbi:hypothetical protein IPG41_06565 [Candidatus Peregrinibacteria bacterium]|nr:MAG: hypothetical protein IPG41_06565 [Candidatus Peregrinibacteria bacterium]